MIGLADKHDPARLEAACAKAIAAGDPSYRTVKGILAAGTERTSSRCGRGRRGGGVARRGGIPLPGPSDALPRDAAETRTAAAASGNTRWPPTCA